MGFSVGLLLGSERCFVEVRRPTAVFTDVASVERITYAIFVPFQRGLEKPHP